MIDISGDVIKKVHFERYKNLRDTTKKSIAQHIFVDCEGAVRVLYTRGIIKKANLTFVAKFILLLFCDRLSPTATQHSDMG